MITVTFQNTGIPSGAKNWNIYWQQRDVAGGLIDDGHATSPWAPVTAIELPCIFPSGTVRVAGQYCIGECGMLDWKQTPFSSAFKPEGGVTYRIDWKTGKVYKVAADDEVPPTPVPEEEEEKKWLTKYWWVIAVAVVVLLIIIVLVARRG